MKCDVDHAFRHVYVAGHKARAIFAESAFKYRDGPDCARVKDMATRFGRSLICGLAASLLNLLPGPVVADQASASLRVSLRVVASCSVRTQPLALADLRGRRMASIP